MTPAARELKEEKGEPETKACLRFQDALYVVEHGIGYQPWAYRVVYMVGQPWAMGGLYGG